MAKTVEIRGRTYLPGQGRDSSGNPKQGKQMVWGRVNITSYTSGGEPVSPNDVGLTTIDHLSPTIYSLAGSEVGVVEASVIWQSTNNELVIFATAANQAAAASTAVVSFLAVGDSAHDVQTLP
jgi:hypothetical protein